MPSVSPLLIAAGPEVQDRLIAPLQPLALRSIAVADGRSALHAAQAERPSLVIAAETLPDMSGWDLCAQFKALPALRECWFILLLSTVPDGPADQNLCLADDYVSSECTPFELHARICTGLRMVAMQDKAEKLQQELEIVRAEQERDHEYLTHNTRELVEMAAQLHAEMCRNAEREVERLQSARIDTISQAAAALRHEINNPLFAITGSAESAIKRLRLLENQGVGDLEGLYHCLDRIQRGADRIDKVVQAISEMLNPVTTDYVPGVPMLDLSTPPPTHCEE